MTFSVVTQFMVENSMKSGHPRGVLLVTRVVLGFKPALVGTNGILE
jgi:hypothetical protein